MNRRFLLTSAAPFLIVVGCAGVTNAQQYLKDAQAILTGIQQLLPAFGAAVPTQVAMWLADAQKALAALSSQMNITSAQQFVAAVQSILAAVSGLGVLPPPYSLFAAAISALLPVVAQLFGVQVPRLAVESKWPAMSVEQARKVLGE